MAKKIIDSDTIIKENLKLKKEHEWDKHKIAYLESMLELNGIDPNKYHKKREEVILSALTNKDVKNITMLCDIAGISREAYYKYLRNKDKETLNNQILEVIRSVQKETSYAIGHRPMKEVVNEVLNIKVGEGRILRIMKGNNLLSHVRVKKWTPSQYKRRK